MVADVLKERHPGIYVTGEFVDSPAKFPAVTIIQADSSEDMTKHTIQGEQAAKLMCEITVYTNRVGYKKLDAWEIMETVDDVMTGKIVTDGRRAGFHRTMCSQIPNLQDSNIYSLTARYQGLADKDFMIYTN